VIGLLALAGLVLLVLYGLVISPADREMDDSVRLMYIHVPSATYLYVGCFVTTVASGLWLWRRTSGWDALAEAGAEVALVFSFVTLLTGSLWGRPTWGTYWTWDARLTSTAVLTALLVGYLALRRLDLDPDARSTRAAVLGLLLVPNVVVVNRSVEWWRSLHQDSTLVSRPTGSISTPPSPPAGPRPTIRARAPAPRPPVPTMPTVPHPTTRLPRR
jgi:heme exporter protein C